MAASGIISLGLVTSGKSASQLQTLFDKVKKVFYSKKNFVQVGGGASGAALATEALFGEDIAVDLEFPVLEDGVTFNTGDTETTEIKLTDGTVWTSKATKGDSDISFQVASINDEIAQMFLSKKTSAAITNVKSCLGAGSQTNPVVFTAGIGYSLDVKKVTGSLLMFDESGNTMIILPNVEMYGSLTQDGDNPAYFNVKVTPKTNKEGVSIYVFNKA